MESTAVEVNTGEMGGKPPDSTGSSSSNGQAGTVDTAPVMHTLQPVMTGPNGEQLGALMQPPMSVPLMMSPYQMMVLPQAMAQMGNASSPSMQQSAQGSPAAQGDSSRSGTPQISAGQPMTVFSQGLPISQAQAAEHQAQLLQAVAASHLHQQQSQDNGPASVSQSPAPQSADSQGSPAPPTPGSMGSPMPPVMGDALPQVSGLPIQIAPGQVGLPVGMAGLGFQPQVVEAQPETPKEEKQLDLKPPKKPLTPYMRFSKSIWQQVKAANQGMSVCEIGATIGRMWRELGDTDKQHYNEEFTQAKVKYEEDLQAYLKMTGLQASDLVKAKRKKDTKKAAPRAVAHNNAAAGLPAQQFVNLATPVSVNGPVTIPFQQTAAGTVVSGAAVPGALPHFSQVWTGQQQYTMAVTSGFANGEGGGEAIPVQQVQVQNTDGAAPGTVLYSQQLPGGQQLVTTVQASQANSQVIVSSGAAVAGTQQTLVASQGEPQSAPEASTASWHWPEPKEGERPANDILSQAVSSISPAVTEGKEDVEMKECSTAQVQYPTAHTLYNSYGYNPWTAYTDSGAKPEGTGKPVVSEREKALETEISHLKTALSEKTKEVKRLEQELHKAYDIIERMHQGSAQHQALAPGTPHATSPTESPTPPAGGPSSNSSGAAMVTSSSEVGEVSSMLVATTQPSSAEAAK